MADWNIGVTGAAGLIGRRVVELAVAGGHRVVGYSRDPSRAIPGCAEVRAFRPGATFDASGLDAVVHLAGEPVVGLWTARKRAAIRDSRVMGTRSVVEGIAAAGGKATLVSASAIGYYGDTGEREVDESSSPGYGFLADVSRAWEAEAEAAQRQGSRVVILRIGFVLGRGGGAMVPLRRAFRLGLGGRLGNGRQWMSLVHVDDVAGLALRALESPDMSGAYNATMPEPLRNADFTRMVAREVCRPAFFPAPAPLLRLALGGLSSLLLDSHRVLPARTLADGYLFRFPAPLPAIRDSLH